MRCSSIFYHNFSIIKLPMLYNHFELTLSVLNILAISGTSGSSGFGSHKREQMDSNTENFKKQHLKHNCLRQVLLLTRLCNDLILQ